MSCGRNRRRLKLSSTLNSRLYTHPETSSAKIHLLSHGKKSNPSEPSSKQTSREITNEFDRFRVNVLLELICIDSHIFFLEDFG
jgi:hypothetical protein